MIFKKFAAKGETEPRGTYGEPQLPPQPELFASGADGGAETSASYAPVGNIARYLAWVFLLLIIGLSIFLCLMLANRAKEVLVTKQYEYAYLLSDNLNHQIYRRFTLPTLVGFGRIALRQPAQYERLDQLIRQVIHGMNVNDLRIYDHSEVITYTINSADLGRGGLASQEVRQAMTANRPVCNVDSNISTLGAFFSLQLEPGAFMLRTTAPLRIETRLNSSEDEGPVMGVLEFTQDITADMMAVLQFQRSVIAIVLISSLLIFMIMVIFLRRAERALAARVQEKERLQQQLHQHEKLAGMGRVIAGIAHEIRNPLGIICSSSQLLLKRTKESDQSSMVILQAIFDESRRLSQTVTDFLDYAKPKSPRQENVNIGSVINQALIFMKPELDQSGISLEKNLLNEDDQPSEFLEYLVTGDKDLLYRAFYNILINAAQAVSESAQRKVSLLVRKASATQYPEGAVEVLVGDSGPGFASEDVARFLDPFYTTKPLGSGLGLPIVNSIITSHKGTLELMNKIPDGESGGGAVVRVILPLAQNQTAQA